MRKLCRFWSLFSGTQFYIISQSVFTNQHGYKHISRILCCSPQWWLWWRWGYCTSELHRTCGTSNCTSLMALGGTRVAASLRSSILSCADRSCVSFQRSCLAANNVTCVYTTNTVLTDPVCPCSDAVWLQITPQCNKRCADRLTPTYIHPFKHHPQ